MCGKKAKAPAPAQVVQRDPVADQAKAEAEAQQAANAELAAKRRRRGWQSSLATAGRNAASTLGNSQGQGNSLLPQANPGG